MDREAAMSIARAAAEGPVGAIGAGIEATQFCAHDNKKTQGTIHLLVAKDTGLPLRLQMGNPQAGQTMKMDYSELSQPVSIEIPPCMGSAP
jgi:hypothetical protein